MPRLAGASACRHDELVDDVPSACVLDDVQCLENRKEPLGVLPQAMIGA